MGPPPQCGEEEAPGPGRSGRGAQGPGTAPYDLRPRVPCRVLTVAPRAVSGPSAAHPLAGGLAASLPERGPPWPPRLLAPLPARHAPPPPRPRLAPPAAAGNWQPLRSRCRSGHPPRPNFAARGSWRGAWAGRGESGVRGRDREGWVARSPALLPFCTPCGKQRAAAAAAAGAGGLCLETGRRRDRQTDGRTARTLREPPRHG